MSQYTPLTLKQAKSIVLEKYGFKITALDVLNGGSANTNYRIKTSEGSFVLTICNEKSMVQAEVLGQLLEHLSNYGFTTSKLIRSSKDKLVTKWKDSPLMIKEYFEGNNIYNFSLETLEKIGRQLGFLHQIKVPNNMSPLFSYGVEKFVDPEITAQSPFYIWLQKTGQYIHEHISDELPKALIHGDLFSSNVIISKESSEPIIMDFEEACYYYRVFDIGMAAIGLCTDDTVLNLEKVQHLLKGYKSWIKMTREELKSLKAFTVYGAAATAYWRYKQFNIVNPDPSLSNHYLEMQRLADHVINIPDELMY